MMAKTSTLLAILLLASLASGSVLKIATFDGSSATTFPWKFLGDPVMGGASQGTFNVDSKMGVGVLKGTVAIIPFLKAPGKIYAYSEGQIADVSAYLKGSLRMRVRSTIPYNNWKIAFAAPGIPKPATAPYGVGNFKADVNIEGTEWQTVSVPFSSFSWDTSRFTGECSTTDPDGTKHRCCGKDHPEVCPTAKYLRTINQLQVWAEGAVGDVHLEIESFSVSMEAPAAVTSLEDEKAQEPHEDPKHVWIIAVVSCLTFGIIVAGVFLYRQHQRNPATLQNAVGLWRREQYAHMSEPDPQGDDVSLSNENILTSTVPSVGP